MRDIISENIMRAGVQWPGFEPAGSSTLELPHPQSWALGLGPMLDPAAVLTDGG